MNLREQLLKGNLDNPVIVRALFDVARNDEDVEFGRKVRNLASQKAKRHASRDKGKEFLEIYWDVMLWLAQNRDFDSFLLYLEKNRKPDDRFYQNRRAIMKPLVDAFQEMLDDKLDELFISMPARVGKTAFSNFLTAFVIGLEPERTNLYCSYETGVADTFYKGVLEIIEDDKTYTYHEIFPGVTLAATNAAERTVDMGRRKKYPTLRCTSIDAGLNGKADCDNFLIGDDLCSGIEEALSKERLDKKWKKVQNDLLRRQVGKRGLVVWIGTRWSIYDPIGRRRDLLENNTAYQHIRWRAIDIPALDENEESNFDYPNGKGFSTEQFKQIRAGFEEDGDLASWLAQCMCQPIERSGQVFPPDGMRYYNGVLPDGEPDRVFSFVDVAFGGGDYLSAPIFYQYGDDIYVHDVVYDPGDKNVTRPKLVAAFKRNNVGSVCFEGTRTSSDFWEYIDNRLREDGFRINIMSRAASTQKRKEERIFEKAPEIREFLFLDNAHRSPEYAQFMRNVWSFTISGTNKHDDGPDSLAGGCDMIRRTGSKPRIIDRPF